MLRFKLILLPSALALALPGWAAAAPEKAPGSQARPLNLSLPRDVLYGPGSGQSDETAQRNLVAPEQGRNGSDSPARPAGLPYGAGYEHRHQGMQGAGGAAGAGAGAGSGNGAGRRGR